MDNNKIKKTNKGFMTQVEGDSTAELLIKLRSLRGYWEWADKLKDQFRFYRLQEEKNAKLRMPEIMKRDSSMFFVLFSATVAQILKSFDEEPKIELPAEVRELKDKLGFNLFKFGESVCYPGKMILNEKLLLDVIRDNNVQLLSALHVNIGYFIDKKQQELLNKDVFPFAMDKY